MKSLAVVLVTIASVFGSGGAVARADPAVDSFLAGIPAALAGATSADQVLAALAGAPAEVAVSESAGQGDAFTVHLQFPVRSASWLASAWRLDGAYAVSTDVHQLSWHVVLFTQELPDPGGARIAVGPIAFGRWTVDPRLQGRPDGALPDVVAGASPAYDLARASAGVTSIDIAGPLA